MVEYKEQELYKCPYCGREYGDYGTAYECAVECADVDSPEQDTKCVYICQGCNKEYEDEDEAKGCEEHHAENDDKYNYNLNRIKLKIAGESPSQMKLCQ